MSRRPPLVIGLAGGTGSGKSTVAEALVAATGTGSVAVVPQDVYYKKDADFDQPAGTTINYDVPEAFDTVLLVDHVNRLKSGVDIAMPVYDFARSDRSSETTPRAAAPVIVVEGILVLHDERLRSMMNLKVFVDAPADERFIRRLERDVNMRGRSAQHVIDQYRASVKPMHDLYVEP